MRGSITFVMLVAACGPTVAADEESTIEMPGTGGETATSAGEGSETGTESDACVAADPAQCPADCYRGRALQVIDDACGTIGVELCLPGGPKPGVPLTTFWAQAPAGPVFAEYGGACSVAARPDVWRECSGAADEPADCACFCQDGYCPGDADRRALDECGLASPCGPLLVDAQFGAVDHDGEACVLEGLGARTPGVYEITTADGTSTTRFYVVGDGLVSRIERTSDAAQSCPQTSDWGSASTCMLAAEAYFAACMDPLDAADDCVLDLEAWVSGCTPGPIACD